MHEAVDDVIQRRRADPGGLGRIMSVSLAVHVTTVVIVFAVPRAWLVHERVEPVLMTISLGGSLGERSGGMVAAGARPVEQVAPPPKRPEPIPPATPKKSTMIANPARTPAKAPPKPAEPGATTSALTRPPTTGAQVTRGTAVADTGATGQGTGLTFGGGAGGATVTLDSNFCCPDWASEVARRISAQWSRVQPVTGTTVVVFEILKDGTFTRPEIEKSSGSVLLDVASKSAFDGLKLPPLPKEYPADRLKIHLTFPYVR
jgi:outer membrane biosynthesis protein TonB